MKHKTPIIAAVGLIACVTVSALVAPTNRAPTTVVLSLVGYTNDAWLHSALYSGSSTTTARIAVFAVTNESSWRTFMYWRGSVQVKGPHDWAEDAHDPVGGSEVTSPVGPHQSQKISFPVPDGTSTWRCSVRTLDMTYSQRIPPKWRHQILRQVRRAGLDLEPFYAVWSTELAR